MTAGADITTYDFAIIAIFTLLIGRGIWLGFLKQVTTIVALYVGYIIAGKHHEQLLPFLKDFAENPKLVFLASYVILFFATYVVVMLVGKLLAFVIEITIAGWFDRFLGAILGFAKGVILVLLLHMVLGAVLAPENQMLRTCMSCDVLNQGTSITWQLIESEEVRKALQQQEPAITLDTVKEMLKSSDAPAQDTPQ